MLADILQQAYKLDHLFPKLVSEDNLRVQQNLDVLQNHAPSCCLFVSSTSTLLGWDSGSQRSKLTVAHLGTSVRAYWSRCKGNTVMLHTGACKLPNQKYQEKTDSSQSLIVTIEMSMIVSVQWHRNVLQYRRNSSLIKNYTLNFMRASQHNQVKLLLILIPLYQYFKVYQSHWKYHSSVILITDKVVYCSWGSKQGWEKVLRKCCVRPIKPCELHFSASVKSEGYILASDFKNNGKPLHWQSQQAGSASQSPLIFLMSNVAY